MTIAFIVLIVVGAALVLYLLFADMSEMAVPSMAALIILAASSAWMELAPILIIFGSLGLVIVGVLAMLIYKGFRRPSSDQTGRGE